jgi:NAD(P)-dependent dehydrogenase (short-subunit alcohol dehydrogenase family)
MKLTNKTALITGGNSGIGLATARLFVAEGANVAITGRNQKTLPAAAAELGDGAVAIQADVTDIDAIEGAVAAAAERFGKLDIVFANAGIGGATPIGQTSQAAFDEIIRTNLTAVFFTVQAAATHLKEGASIILNGSVRRHGRAGIFGLYSHQGWRACHDPKSRVGVRTTRHPSQSGYPGRSQNAHLVGICAHRRSYGRPRTADRADYSARSLWRSRRGS